MIHNLTFEKLPVMWCKPAENDIIERIHEQPYDGVMVNKSINQSCHVLRTWHLCFKLDL